jgi:hypothetical protein
MSSKAKAMTKARISSLTSYESLISGGDKTKEILMQKKNANFDKLTCDILKEQQKQKLAAIHYSAINNWLLFAPTMAITLFSAVISIFGTSQLVDPNAQLYLGIIVAILQLVLSLFQSISKQLNFGGRAGFHNSASNALKNLYENAQHSITEGQYTTISKALKTNKSISQVYNEQNKDDSDSDDEGGKKATDKQIQEAEQTKEEEEAEKEEEQRQASITKQYKQAIEQVDSLVPINIEAAFSMLESRIMVINQSLMIDKSASLVAWERILPALYYQLSETIIDTFFWPFIVPPPQDSVEKALRDFKIAIDVSVENSADLLMTIVERCKEIDEVQHKLAKIKVTKDSEMRLAFEKSERILESKEEDIV